MVTYTNANLAWKMIRDMGTIGVCLPQSLSKHGLPMFAITVNIYTGLLTFIQGKAEGTPGGVAIFRL